MLTCIVAAAYDIARATRRMRRTARAAPLSVEMPFAFTRQETAAAIRARRRTPIVRMVA